MQQEIPFRWRTKTTVVNEDGEILNPNVLFENHYVKLYEKEKISYGHNGNPNIKHRTIQIRITGKKTKQLKLDL